MSRSVPKPRTVNKLTYKTIQKAVTGQREMADGELESAENIQEVFLKEIAYLHLDAATDCIWITSNVVAHWALKVLPQLTARKLVHIVRNMAKTQMIPQLSTKIDKFPRNVPNHRGLMWNIERYYEGEEVHILLLTEDDEVKIINSN